MKVMVSCVSRKTISMNLGDLIASVDEKMMMMMMLMMDSCHDVHDEQTNRSIRLLWKDKFPAEKKRKQEVLVKFHLLFR